MRATRWIGILGGLALGGVTTACSILTKLDDPTDGPSDASVSTPLDAPITPLLDAPADTPSDAPAEARAAKDASTDGGTDLNADAKTPYYGAEYVDQSFPFATSALSMVEGQIIPSYIELKNIGDATWDTSTQLGTTEPRNRVSLFADNTWLSTDRAAAVTGKIAPGATYKFQFDLQAPSTPGTYFEHFGLVDGTIWFGDPGQGGPPDGDIEVQIVVTAP